MAPPPRAPEYLFRWGRVSVVVVYLREQLDIRDADPVAVSYEGLLGR
jgi:hypothetical protein